MGGFDTDSSLQNVTQSIHTSTYRADIDGLRAVAVCSVVVFHAFPGVIPGGFVGVDIFFVISGYLITSIIISDIEANNFSIFRFYDRRIRRIFPALIIVLLITFCVGWLILFTPEFTRLGRHIVASSLFYENILLLNESGYFDVTSASKPLLHLWSLAIEEQFYIFWPILIYAAYRGHIKFASIFLLIGIISFSINLFDIHKNQSSAYFSPFGRFWELMLGAGLAQLQARGSALLTRNQDARSLIGAILIIFSLFIINERKDFPGLWAFLPTLGAVLLISAGSKARINRVLLSSKPFVWLGLISYPLYLWHWPLFSYSYVIFGDHFSPMIGILRIGLVIAAIILAILTFLFVEIAFRKKDNRVSKPMMLLAAMTTVLVIGAGISVQAFVPRLYQLAAPNHTEWDFLKTTFHNSDPNVNGLYAFHPERPNLTVFIGDSQLAQYAERIAKLVDDPQRNGAILAIGGGCIPIEDVFTNKVERKGCWDLRSRGFQLALEDRMKTVVIGGSWNWYFSLSTEYFYRDGPNELPLDAPAGRTAALARLQKQIEALVAAGKKVYLVLGNPKVGAFSQLGIETRLLSSARITPNRLIEAPEDQLLLRNEVLAMAQRAGAIAIDPFPAICDGKYCRTTTDSGLPIFYDDSHFNPDWAINETKFMDVVTAR